MSLRIRLSRGGAKKRPYYRIVVADSRSPRDGRYIERIGTHDPMLARDDPNRVKIDEERAKHWIGVGAKPSDRVARYLAALGIGEKPTIHEQSKQHLPRKKTLERLEALKEAEAAAATAAAAAPAEEAVAEAPAEEAAAEAPAEEAAAEAPAEEAVAEAPAEEAAAEAPAEEAAAEAPAEEAVAEAPAEEESKDDKAK